MNTIPEEQERLARARAWLNTAKCRLSTDDCAFFCSAVKSLRVGFGQGYWQEARNGRVERLLEKADLTEMAGMLWRADFQEGRMRHEEWILAFADHMPAMLRAEWKTTVAEAAPALKLETEDRHDHVDMGGGNSGGLLQDREPEVEPESTPEVIFTEAPEDHSEHVPEVQGARGAETANGPAKTHVEAHSPLAVDSGDSSLSLTQLLEATIGTVQVAEPVWRSRLGRRCWQALRLHPQGTDQMLRWRLHMKGWTYQLERQQPWSQPRGRGRLRQRPLQSLQDGYRGIEALDR